MPSYDLGGDEGFVASSEKPQIIQWAKPFYPDLAAFITSGPVLAMEWEGEEAVEVARALMGVTDPKKAAPGTIRGDFGLVTTENIVHGSDSPASAERELGLFFA